MKVSLLIPFVPAKVEEVIPIASYFAQSGHLSRLWQGQAYGLEPMATFACLAGAGYRLPVGLCVLVTPIKHPYQAALEARTLASVTGQSPIVGYGPASRAVQKAMLGAPYSSQLDASAEYLLGIRRSLGALTMADTRHPSFGRSDYFHLDSILPHIPAPPVRLGFGVLRPRMAELAGSLADAAITWLTPARYIEDVVAPSVCKGAEQFGRPKPDVVALVPAALARPGRDAIEMSHASAGAHLGGPHYADMLAKAGIHVGSADPLKNAEEFLNGEGFLFGSGRLIAEGLAAYEAAGVDEVVLNLTSSYAKFGLSETLVDLNEILAALPPSRQV